MDNKKVLFSIPDYWNNYKLNLTLIELTKEHPEYFYDGVVIDSVYGSFPCIWNGGRYISGETSINNIINTIEPFNSSGVSCRHTFTNNLLTETDVYDALGNAILKLTEHVKTTTGKQIKNGVNIVSSHLEKYIKENYPDFYILYSTTLYAKSPEEINKRSEHNIIVPDYRINNKWDILNQLAHPENIEILVGEMCIDNCPDRAWHHMQCSKMQRYLPLTAEEEIFKCPHGCEIASFTEIGKTRDHFISVENLYGRYLDMGINKFKISGRKDGYFTNIERYVYYLVKPEYQSLVTLKLVRSVMK